ncbi:MAG: hypothetical protein IJ494_09840 [Bacteroides sp.]|nr:hypothetical protein [Bacteroides sp.]
MRLKNFPLLLLSLLLIFALAGCKKKPKPMKMNEPRNIRGVANYKRAFNDLNDAHLAVAQAIGVPSVKDREEAEKLKRKLKLIRSNEYYTVDSLTHSIPYLIPGAARLLEDIGRNFLDSLTAKGLNPNRVIVTSVLRTENDVRRLRRVNINASAQSVHRYGTTFDISWKRFEKVEDPDDQPMEDVPEATLKAVLAEVLRDLKADKRCYIKYEVKQGCFHITTRK